MEHRPTDIAAIVIFCSGGMLGFLVTAFMEPEQETWWLWPGLRVLWQLGAAIWFAFALGNMVRPCRSGRVHIVALRHLEILLFYKCMAPKKITNK